MTHLAPHDLSDVLLAPTALRLDSELDVLAQLTPEQLELRVSLVTDRQPRGVVQRRRLVLEMLRRDLVAHDWQLSWAPRGLALTHTGRRLVLGLPDNLRAFLAG